MKIDTDEITKNEDHVGEKVWICHYLQPDIDKKPLRSVPPTRVIIRSNDELPCNKTVYYSAVHFSPLGAKGQALARVISPVDNTGFRSRSGNSLCVYTTEAECVASWNAQLSEVMARLKEKEQSAAKEWREKRFVLRDMRKCAIRL